MKSIKTSIFLAAFLFVLIVCCGSASAATYNIDSTKSIQTYINNAQPGDTINLASGTYNQHNIVVDKNLTITGPTTSSKPSSVINAREKSGVFTINSGVSATLKYLTITNGSTTNDGGGIVNYGNLTVSHCYIIHNTADGGGGICNNGGTVTVAGSYISSNSGDIGGGILNVFSLSATHSTMTLTGCHISNNTATSAGGGIYNNVAYLTMKNSYIYSNTATIGGGIFNHDGNLIVSGCDFGMNKATGATDSDGNAILNGSNSSKTILHFNRFNDPYSGHEISAQNIGTVDAKYNWWGSNKNPSSKVSGSVIYTPWLVLRAKASPNPVKSSKTSVVTANLWYDSNKKYHNPINGHLLNGVTVAFTATLGKIKSQASTVNGSAKNTFTSGTTKGKARISIKLNNQTIYTYITIS